MRLTENFTLEELTDSDTAVRLGIDNTPSYEILDNLTTNAMGMQRVKGALGGAAVLVSSGYRCEALERVIAQKDFVAWCKRHGKADLDAAWSEYFAHKSHPKGLSTDFRAPSAGTPAQICQVLYRRRDYVGFDKLIMEGTWVHVSFPPLGAEPRLEVMTASFINGEPSYAQGLS